MLLITFLLLGEGIIECIPCNKRFTYKSSYKKHCQAIHHRKNVAKYHKNKTAKSKQKSSEKDPVDKEDDDFESNASGQDENQIMESDGGTTESYDNEDDGSEGFGEDKNKHVEPMEKIDEEIESCKVKSLDSKESSSLKMTIKRQDSTLKIVIP